MHHRRSAIAALVTALALPTLLACNSGGGGGAKSPTAPSGPQASLPTAYGNITVYTHGHGFDAGRALAAIDAGYARARAQVGPRIDGIRLDGMTIEVQPGVFDGAVGQYHPGSNRVDVAQGIENVLTHELQHRFCHNLGHSGACCTYQDHASGFDLQCKGN